MTAINGHDGFAPVLAALSTMQSNVERSQKSQAHEYLEKFQKSVGLRSASELSVSLLIKPYSNSQKRGLQQIPCCHLQTLRPKPNSSPPQP